MAKITPYQQGNLASSVVGTPGVDHTGTLVGQTVAQIAGQQAGQSLQLNEGLRNHQDQAFLNDQHKQQLQQAHAFDGIGQELQHRATVQKAQDQYDIERMQHEQAQRDAAQQAATAKVNTSNANLTFGMDAEDLYKGLSTNKAIKPEDLPDLAKTQLAKLRDDRLKDMPPEVQTGFIVDANKQIESLHAKARDQATTFATHQAIADRSVTEQKMINRVQSTTDLDAMNQYLQSPDGKQEMYNVHGAEADKVAETMMNKASINMLRSYSQKDPETALKLTQSGQFDDLGSGMIKSVEDAAHVTIARDTKQQKADNSLQASKDHTGILSLADGARPDPKAGIQQQYQKIADARDQLVSGQQEEFKKPQWYEGAPTKDPHTGARIAYQNESTLKLYDAQIGKLDGYIHEKQRDDAHIAAADAKEAKAKTVADKAAAGEQTRNIQAAQGEFTSLHKQAQPEIASLGKAIAALSVDQSLDVKDQKFADKKAHFKATDDEVVNFSQAVGAFIRAGDKLDPKESSMYLQKLQAAGKRIQDGSPEGPAGALTEKAMDKLLAPAPHPLNAVLNEWHGVHADAANRIFTSELVDKYHRFKDQMSSKGQPNVEPVPAHIEGWRNDVYHDLYIRGLVQSATRPKSVGK